MTINPYESPENKSEPLERAAARLGSIVQVVVLIGLVGLLLLMVMPRWPIGGARESARRAACSNNLKQIALALHNYADKYGCLPPAYTVDEAGKPLHSWRTLLLPFLEQKALYDQIDLTKPWDDPVNRQVRETVLRMYECPSNSRHESLMTHTTYLAVVAPNGCFKATGPRVLPVITDRRDLTLMVIEVGEKHAVHWMSPNDATEEMIVNREADADFSHPGGSMAAFVDGSVRYLHATIPGEVLKAMISIDGKDDEIAEKLH
jgi:prepilin-type processing-associated H-X9-DG protein